MTVGSKGVWTTQARRVDHPPSPAVGPGGDRRLAPARTARPGPQLAARSSSDSHSSSARESAAWRCARASVALANFSGAAP